MEKNKFLIVVLTLVLCPLYSSAQDHPGVSYGQAARQFLDIYIAPSSCPTPVYFDAHFNGGTTAMPKSITDSLTKNGISVVSWESITTLTTAADILIGWNDAALMFTWVKANASTYNFDTSNFIIGGSSRGTILSWKEAHKIDPNIKGLYMYNALPGNAWADSTIWYPPGDVTSSSPPIFFVYNREPGCSTDPINPDIHDPDNGIKIQNRYSALGIGDRDTLIHSIGDSANSDRYQYLLEFALSVIDTCASIGIKPQTLYSKAIEVSPNPFNDRLNISGLIGQEKFTLHNAFGKTLFYRVPYHQMDIRYLKAGIYFLSVENSKSIQTLRLVKN